jgi:hypothetical protein
MISPLVGTTIELAFQTSPVLLITALTAVLWAVLAPSEGRADGR